MSSSSTTSLFRQPLQVWGVAFAAVVAFMGIGLVDPILANISQSLHATPVETELLFTSYLLVTGVAMFFTSWVSGRIGARNTLLLGLGIIVVFALLCAVSGNVELVIGFRGGWGLGNALFISTALATIVGAATGGSEAAIVLYEAALGVGIAFGPLAGWLLSSTALEWRGPFIGVAVLMAIGFIIVAIMVRTGDEKPQRIALSAPFTALGKPALALLAAAAFLYNVGFFTLLAFTPFVLEPHGFGAAGVGLTFFGWGLGLAVTSVWAAPRLLNHVRRTTVLIVSYALLAIDLGVMALLIDSPAGLVTCVVVGGLVLGFINTTITEAVMEATDLPRSVASSSYSGVRFLGGAVAPPLAAFLAHLFNPSVSFLVGGAAVVLALLVIVLGRPALARVDRRGISEADEATAVLVGDAA